MKNKIVLYSMIAVSMLTASYGTAQVKKLVDIKKISSIKPGSRIVDSNSAKFIGTWVYENGTDKITMVLSKLLSSLGSGPNNIEIEIINGGYKYVKRGNEIVNTLQSKPLYGTTKGTTDEVTFSVTNPKTSKETIIVAKLIGDNTFQLSPSDKRGEGIVPDKGLEFLYNVKFVKQ